MSIKKIVFVNPSFILAALFVFAFQYSTPAHAQLGGGYLTPSQIDLNREGVALSSKQKKKFYGLKKAFRWNNGDNKTAKWRPQGITSFSSGGRKFLAVSWYGRKDAGYTNRGVRISIVDLSSMPEVRYRHVLLVDKNYRTFSGMHAGGLAYHKGRLHVPDTRAGRKIVHVFALNQILEVPKHLWKSFFNYRYVLRQETSYKVPVKPSFMSFDSNANQVLIGSFFKCSSKHSDSVSCRKNPKNLLAWYSFRDGRVSSRKVCGPFFSEMQGAASGTSSKSGQSVLWTASSYGRRNPSHLHVAPFNRDSCATGGLRIGEISVIPYPPGLEDLHITKNSKTIWMLTEFGPHEGKKNNRVVFSIPKATLLPSRLDR